MCRLKRPLFLTILLCTACLVRAQQYTISGNLHGFKNNTLVKLTDDDEHVIARTWLKHGKFHFKGTLSNGPQYLSVNFPTGDEEYECTVFAGNGPISIKGSKGDFPYQLIITGPDEQLKYNAHQAFLIPLYRKRDSAMKAYLQIRNDTAAAHKAGIVYNAIVANEYIVTRSALLRHVNTYYAANGLYNYLPELSKDSLQFIQAALSPTIRKSVYGKRIDNYIRLSEIIKVNDSYFDFTAENQYGKMLKLSDIKNQYILLEFSSIHCGPCEEAINEIKQLSQRYKGRLSVVTFSPDNRKDWLQGLKQNQINWLSLHDNKGYYSDVIIKYGISAVPVFFLIAPNGKVVEKWPGYEKLASEPGQLEQHISKHLN